MIYTGYSLDQGAILGSQRLAMHWNGAGFRPFVDRDSSRLRKPKATYKLQYIPGWSRQSSDIIRRNTSPRSLIVCRLCGNNLSVLFLPRRFLCSLGGVDGRF
jgi:hypothetical protein